MTHELEARYKLLKMIQRMTKKDYLAVFNYMLCMYGINGGKPTEKIWHKGDALRTLHTKNFFLTEEKADTTMLYFYEKYATLCRESVT